MPGSILGNAVRRVEDPELLLGRGTFIDNLRVDGLLHLAFVRSPFASATITAIDTAEAEKTPGVAAVLTAADLGIPPFHSFGAALNDACARPALADGRVRFVGEPVVAVVADTKAAALDAAEAVIVDYDPLPAAVDPEAALAPGAPVQFDAIGSNLAASIRSGNDPDPLAGADVVVRGRFVNQRVAVMPMEGNAIAAIPAPEGTAAGGPLMTIYGSTQMPHLFARLAGRLFGFHRGELRVIAPHVGGAFGSKAGIAAEHAVAIAAARRLERPVRWVETRSENLVAMPHGRGQIQYVEAGFTTGGEIVGMRCRVVGDAGAYGGFGGGLPLGSTRSMAQGVYRIPKIAYDCAVALTNTTPMGAFRGAGRPEAAAMLERMMDLAADELDIDPVELRRRNLIAPDQFPYTTVMGTRYDVGDYDLALREATALAGYDDLLADQAARRERGDVRQLGIGVAAYVEVTGGGGAGEFASVDVHEDGTATIRVGTSAHGQGHATSFAMIVADRLGIPIDSIRFVQSDTAEVPRGGGTGGSRSLQLGGNAVGKATDEVLAQARRLAADLLEASPDDIVVTDDGRVGVAGVPATALGWHDLATAATARGESLAAAVDFVQEGATFPFGAHVAVVEVDTDTGAVELVRHVAVDDCGRVLNPLIVAGQQHGGIAQGAAQALWEEMVYDDDGNPLTSTLAEYAMPSAAELPTFEATNTETPTPLNPLGAKGIGESGTIGSTPAVQNAVIDALSHLGVRHIDMPCTPQRVWRAIEAARRGAPEPAWREPPAVFDTLPGGLDTPDAADIEI
ncbi:MAG TPA: xanthine dehydrogenase family protein molybdopterin-binding subunit [Acidimicrobiales bacterium]|nr:xanthine dehydrogenase family protein molybdopterin-binding subunit [Acidimicrobiales bacterium]